MGPQRQDRDSEGTDGCPRWDMMLSPTTESGDFFLDI